MDAVTLMQNNFNNINFLNQTGPCNIKFFKINRPLPPFSNNVINYLNELSKELNKDPRTRGYPDVATFSFYCRKANLMQLKRKFGESSDIKLGRGIVFHIAPSNVPVNFAYSLIAGLLAGNSNIIRVPSLNFDQVSIIVDAIKSLSQKGEYSQVSKRIILVRYDRLGNATAKFSSLCDVRIIWGGDETIMQIRENVHSSFLNRFWHPSTKLRQSESLRIALYAV